MSLQEIYNSLKSSVWFYISIFIILLIIILLIVRGTKKKKLNDRIEQYQIKINELKSHPYAVDIAKMDAIAKVNSSIVDTAQQCKKDYDLIQENIKNSINLLQDAMENVETNNFDACNQNLIETENLLNTSAEITTKLDEVLNGFLNQATEQRKKINELKSDFHDIKGKVNENPNAYTYCWEALDRITDSISHQFSDFEAIMETSKYDQAAQQTEEIARSIDNLNLLIQQLPELIIISKKTIPTRLNELNSNYLVALSHGIYLKHLEIPQNIDEIKNIVDESLTNIKMCQTDGLAQQLSDSLAKINQLSNALEKEKQSYNELLSIKKECENNLNIISDNIDKVKNKENISIERYNLSSINSEITDFINEYDKLNSLALNLNNTFEADSTDSVTLLASYEDLSEKINDLLRKSRKAVEMIFVNRQEEMRARELISRFIVVLNESKASIRLLRLPNISKKYSEDITEAENYISNLNELLKQDKIDIKELNEMLDETQKSIINLYKNVIALSKTTKNIEDYIVLANKYRAFYPEVDSGLYSAELAYRNGEYTKAYKLTISALSLVDPALAEKLNSEIE